jgi:hypothetical protein
MSQAIAPVTETLRRLFDAEQVGLCLGFSLMAERPLKRLARG